MKAVNRLYAPAADPEIKQRGGRMASAGARTYNGGLGQSPGQSPWSGGQGAKPPEAEKLLVF